MAMRVHGGSEECVHLPHASFSYPFLYVHCSLIISNAPFPSRSRVSVVGGYITGIAFNLIKLKAPPKNNPNILIDQIKYIPKDLDKETIEFIESIDFLADDNIMFTEDQLDVFYKTMYNKITIRERFHGINDPGDSMSEDGEGEAQGEQERGEQEAEVLEID